MVCCLKKAVGGIGGKVGVWKSGVSGGQPILAAPFCDGLSEKNIGSREMSENASFLRHFFCTLVVCQGDLKQDIVVRKKH